MIDAARGLLSDADVGSHVVASLVLLALDATMAIGCGGRVSARGPDTDAPGAVDSGGPEGSCPLSYANVPQGLFSDPNMSCPAAEACTYFGQFTCFCEEGSGWQCTEANCLCSSGDDGCVNAACKSDADCPSGQHCGSGLGSPTEVCSAGCQDGGTCPTGATCKMFAP